MPEVTISIGGRKFEIACQAGEEQFLHSAATIYDREAQPPDCPARSRACRSYAVDGRADVGR